MGVSTTHWRESMGSWQGRHPSCDVTSSPLGFKGWPGQSWEAFQWWCVYFLTGFSFSFMTFTDEEKVDERARLSVAAKRLLFRVRCAKWFSLETLTPTEKEAPSSGTSHTWGSLAFRHLQCLFSSQTELGSSLYCNRIPEVITFVKKWRSFSYYTTLEVLLYEQLALWLQACAEAALHDGSRQCRKLLTTGNRNETERQRQDSGILFEDDNLELCPTCYIPPVSSWDQTSLYHRTSVAFSNNASGSAVTGFSHPANPAWSVHSDGLSLVSPPMDPPGKQQTDTLPSQVFLWIHAIPQCFLTAGNGEILWWTQCPQETFEKCSRGTEAASPAGSFTHSPSPRRKWSLQPRASMGKFLAWPVLPSLKGDSRILYKNEAI